ncbi:MAG: TIGR02996 domain-containing protein [Planctomycetales bacterium]
MERAFRAEISSHPADEAPRKIFADWLEERGRDHEAAYWRDFDAAQLYTPIVENYYAPYDGDRDGDGHGSGYYYGTPNGDGCGHGPADGYGDAYPTGNGSGDGCCKGMGWDDEEYHGYGIWGDGTGDGFRYVPGNHPQGSDSLAQGNGEGDGYGSEQEIGKPRILGAPPNNPSDDESSKAE